ncbi:MAG TPA: Maf family nucleotide pyrophosphatase [Rudaea sp.]|nr:Maf family nucleotide pyrophosphatase [Rudaea sp.]
MTTLADVDLVLASTSRYRHELLTRLTPDFRCVAPDVDEKPLPDESPAALADRLALAKAQAVAAKNPGAIVIGSDQVAYVDGDSRVVGKPHTPEIARAQLAGSSGRTVLFRTSVCVVDARHSPHREFAAQDVTRVHFRTLDAGTIARYVEREKPLDCAGSFKCESLGIALFERIDSSDPTALIGLPLIALCRLLRELEIEIP